jgi:hypothetical protein
LPEMVIAIPATRRARETIKPNRHERATAGHAHKPLAFPLPRDFASLPHVTYSTDRNFP